MMSRVRVSWASAESEVEAKSEVWVRSLDELVLGVEGEPKDRVEGPGAPPEPRVTGVIVEQWVDSTGEIACPAGGGAEDGGVSVMDRGVRGVGDVSGKELTAWSAFS